MSADGRDTLPGVRTTVFERPAAGSPRRRLFDLGNEAPRGMRRCRWRCFRSCTAGDHRTVAVGERPAAARLETAR